MIRFSLIFSVLVFSYSFCFSQTDSSATEQPTNLTKKEIRKERNKKRIKYFTFGSGLTKRNILDKAVSPFLYKGITMQQEFSHFVLSDERHKSFSFIRLQGNLTPKEDRENAVIASYARYNYRIGVDYQIKKLFNDKVNFYLGWYSSGGFDQRFNEKYQNSALSVEQTMFIGPSAYFVFPFGKESKERNMLGKTFQDRDRKYKLTMQWDFPLFSFINRKPYANIAALSDPDPTINDILETNSGFFKVINTRIKTELMYELHNDNYLSFSYTWDYFFHRPKYDTKALHNAMHIWSLTAYLRLSPKNNK